MSYSNTSYPVGPIKLGLPTPARTEFAGGLGGWLFVRGGSRPLIDADTGCCIAGTGSYVGSDVFGKVNVAGPTPEVQLEQLPSGQHVGTSRYPR